MMLWYLTKEKKDELLKQRDAKAKELTKLRKMTPPDLWREDLEGFLEQLDVSALSTPARCRGPFGLLHPLSHTCYLYLIIFLFSSWFVWPTCLT